MKQSRWRQWHPRTWLTLSRNISFIDLGFSQTITTDQGTMFIYEEFENFAANMGFKLLNSSPYCAQVNGQAEASNQMLIKLIKKKIIGWPRKWHLTLNESLWAYRMACHGSTKCSPYELVYGHTTILAWEIRTRSRHIECQENLTADDYKVLMMDDLGDLNCHRLRPFENIEAHKLSIAKYYNKKVKSKQFHKGELVWKLILPIGTKDSVCGK